MTLIVGWKSDGGIIVGADGAATIGSIVEPTRKLRVSNDIIIGTAGLESIGQLYASRVHDLWADQPVPPLAEAQRDLADALFDDTSQIYARAAALRAATGADYQPIADALIALTIEGTPELLHYGPRGLVLAASDDLPFAAIGSGAQVATPFMAHLRDLFGRDKPLTIQQAAWAVVWTLRHVIRLGTSGVDDPIQLTGVGTAAAIELGEPVIQNFEQAVVEAESLLAAHIATMPYGLPDDPPESS